ncbi:unnamed protein product [Onchocerca flexuosa]|uniref:Uncharacterized protein n=1 Tax=Onchocerca flexuosa TaxID=387005 RepID=A0A183HND2_9BILA|nr:unnamed protein product [Onchocerca flexuosa]
MSSSSPGNNVAAIQMMQELRLCHFGVELLSESSN